MYLFHIKEVEKRRGLPTAELLELNVMKHLKDKRGRRKGAMAQDQATRREQRR